MAPSSQAAWTLSGRLAAYFSGLAWEDVPEDLRGLALLRVVDTFGLCLAARREPFGGPLLRFVERQSGCDEASVIGEKKRLPASAAALVHGGLAHGLDYDDTHLESVVHPSSVVVPVALAVGEARGRPGTEILASIVAGCEVMCRLGAAGQGRFHRRGFHASGVIGPLAAALTAGLLIGLDEARLVDAMGVAGSLGGGLLEFLEDGTWSKRIHLGWAGHGGIVAAELASDGFRGPASVIEGRFGLFASYLQDREGLEEIGQGLGVDWKSRGTHFKLYPCAHALHPFIELAFHARVQEEMAPDDIVSFECVVPSWQVPMFCEPWSDKISPRNEYQARTSLPYAVSAALAYGAVDLQTFTPEVMARQEWRELAVRANYRENSAARPGSFGAALRIRTTGGKEHLYEADGQLAQGSAADLRAKYMRNATRALSEAAAEDTLGRILHMTELESVLSLFELTA